MAVRFVGAWRLCIGDGRIQGIESSVFEDVVVYYDLYMYFPHLLCNLLFYKIMLCFVFQTMGSHILFDIFVSNSCFYEFSNKIWYFRKCMF